LNAEYYPKDFIETEQGLVFAVVEQGLEQGKVLCFLRYIKKAGTWLKLNTQQANDYLQEKYPEYLFYSMLKSASLHAVAIESIIQHHQPQQRLKALLTAENPDSIEQDCIKLVQLFVAEGLELELLGVTGSLLIGAQKSSSDIDIVVYGRKPFHLARTIVQNLLAQEKLFPLMESDWKSSYQRRDCDLSYDAYVWHEQRKYNKALINHRKFDLNLIELGAEDLRSENKILSYEKQGAQVVQVQVVNAEYAFDYPARFLIQHPVINEVVCYTATYTGQAEAGEWIEVSGALEVGSDGRQRLLVGSSREAAGEYIKVIPPA